MAEAITGLDQLGEVQKREKIHNASAVFKLPQPVKNAVIAYAKDQQVSEATVYRWALQDFLVAKGYGA